MSTGLRERRKQETRQVISDVATEMFVARGFDEVTIAQVADAAGVAKMTVTNYFPRKEDLVFDRAEGIVRSLADVFAARAPGESLLAAVRRDYAERIARFDPTLGLYAAYAYATIGLDRQVASVHQAMYADLQADLFDVAMLTRLGAAACEHGRDIVVPICPMLRQGWSLVEVRGAQLSNLAREARQWLRAGLWTTFAPEGMALLIDAAKNGELI